MDSVIEKCNSTSLKADNKSKTQNEALPEEILVKVFFLLTTVDDQDSCAQKIEAFVKLCVLGGPSAYETPPKC